MNIVHEIRELQKKVNKLYCVFTGEGGGNTSPTTVYDRTVNITDDTQYATVGDTQLTFNKNVSDFLAANIPDNAQIGETITTNSTVKVEVHQSGVNFVTINGQTVYKSTPNEFTYTPVSPNKVKELILYGKLDSTMLYLAEGEEGDQAVSPFYDGLLIKRILVNDIEEVIIDIDYDAFKMKSDDTWGFAYINNDTGIWAYINRTNYEISKAINVTTPILLGFHTNIFADVWNGKRILLKNITDIDILLQATAVPVPGSHVYFSFYEDKVLKPGEYVNIVLENDDKLHYTSTSETLTTIEQPVLTGNILTIKYIGENGQLQQQNIDLSGLATIDVTITDASYNASTNIITLTDTKGETFSVDLSEFSLLVSIDANGIATLTQEGVTKLQISKVGRTGDYNDLLNKPTIPAPIDISGKLDKPATDGSWVVTKSGSTITYTDASTFGQNISNSNLTWSADRTQNLNAKKLSFTGGRVSVPALELEITAENSVPNKIWTAGTYLWHTNNLGISYRVAYDNQVIKTISGDVTLDDTYHNCICSITANCVITVPNTLRADFNCVFDVIGLSTAQFIAGGTTTFSAPFGLYLRDNMMCTLYKETSTRFRINGSLTLT